MSRNPLGIVISLVSRKGGVGKTTAAVNIASILGKLGYTVAAVGLDPQFNLEGGLGLGLSWKERLIPKGHPTLTEVLDPSLNQEFSILDTLVEAGARDEDGQIVERFENVWVVPGGDKLDDVVRNYYPADAVDVLKPHIERLAERFDFIIIDAPPTLGWYSYNALIPAHFALIPLGRGVDELEGVQATIEHVWEIRNERMINPRLRAVVFINFFHKGTLFSQAQLEAAKTLRAISLKQPIPEREDIKKSKGFGKPIIYMLPNHEATTAFIRLTEEILDVAGVTADG